MKARSQGTVKDSKGLMSERKRERAELPVHGEGIDRRKWRSKRNGRGKLLNAPWAPARRDKWFHGASKE
jgi:hypothetical protein